MPIVKFSNLDLDTSSFEKYGFGDNFLVGEQARKKSIINWIISSKGDYIGEPETGGVLSFLLGAPFEESYAQQAEEVLRSTLPKRFPFIELLSVRVQPDIIKRVWKFHLDYADHAHRQISSLSFEGVP